MENPIPLSPRQFDVLKLVADGLRAQEVATRLGVSRSCVENYLQAAYRKLKAKNRAEAVLAAIRLGIILPPTSGHLGRNEPH